MRWPDCTGFGERQWDKPEGREVQPSKTLWDLLQLLIVPIMLVAFVYLLNASRNGRRCDQGQSKRSVPPSLQAAHAGRSDDPDGVNYTNTAANPPSGYPDLAAAPRISRSAFLAVCVVSQPLKTVSVALRRPLRCERRAPLLLRLPLVTPE